MNLAAWAPAIITLLGVVFIAGQITGRIKDQEKTLVTHNDRLDDHDVKLESLAISNAKMEAWRDGYNAASNRAKGAHSTT